MSIPCFKVYKVISSEKSHIFGQLKTINFSNAPIVLQISEYGENQLMMLDYIEEYLQSIGKQSLPYDVYVISSVEDYGGPLTVFNEMNNLPEHYRRKNRPLNTKETNTMKKIVLKQKNINSLNSNEYKRTLKLYSHQQNELNLLSQYECFLKKVKSKIGVELE